jgi:hypothetical protein
MTRRRFDRRFSRYLLLVCMGMAAAALMVVVFDENAEPSPPLPVRVLLGGAVLLVVGYGIAQFRQKLEADAEGLRVRNLLASFSVRWNEIERFDRPPERLTRAGLGRTFGLQIILKDGRCLHSSLWGQRAIDSPESADEVIAELTRLKDQFS